MNEESFAEVRETYDKIRQEIGRVIVGQESVVDTALTGMMVGGHVLLEGVPGLGKTLLVRTLSQVFDMTFSRIQFTPDLMPSDITGTNVLVEGPDGSREFQFRPGPVFANIVLADEINRATPKTQSALLEAMQEGSVTVVGERHVLSQPFLVLATENPLELEGTYPLPEAQLDRFMFKVNVEYPSLTELTSILRRTTEGTDISVNKVIDGETLLELRRVFVRTPVSIPVYNYVSRVVLATHPDSEEATEMVKKYVRFGVSPRGAQAMILGGKVKAVLNNRHYVSYLDVDAVAVTALRHRVILNFEAEADGITSDMSVEDVLAEVKKRGEKKFGRVI
ncbi:MAG: MoxR family ATPase [Bacillota bacterium]